MPTPGGGKPVKDGAGEGGRGRGARGRGGRRGRGPPPSRDRPGRAAHLSGWCEDGVRGCAQPSRARRSLSDLHRTGAASRRDQVSRFLGIVATVNNVPKWEERASLKQATTTTTFNQITNHVSYRQRQRENYCLLGGPDV